jgi:coproporphyrinogen III oxidase-like Fe-S oxidoreductase
MLGLRLKKGISAAEFKDKTGSDLPEGIMKKAIQLKNSGICDINGDRISLSDGGMLVSNAVINYFTEEL